ncbi:coatomer subunit epsilon-1 [Cajanus cajan]|uniref:coatomer subunit epsilon-1 n=1 Tax=Cajanus cajan TaxID=3821 RepID=UPI0010FB69F2|nr:coatomer subunit epsilon-1 [Cajanus cajan]
MELHALNVQIFIKMHRSDYAKRQLRIMQQMDEDHTLTQIANAWLDLAVGGSKIQEAYLIFQDLSERYQSTSLLLNGKAVCCMHMGNFDEAETFLVEALNKLAMVNPRWLVIHKLKLAHFVDKIGKEWVFLTVGEAVDACLSSKIAKA